MPCWICFAVRSQGQEFRLQALDADVEEFEAWVVLIDLVKPVSGELGRLHGRTSFLWNGEGMVVEGGDGVSADRLKTGLLTSADALRD